MLSYQAEALEGTSCARSKRRRREEQGGVKCGKTQTLQVEGLSVHPLMVSSQLPEITQPHQPLALLRLYTLPPSYLINSSRPVSSISSPRKPALPSLASQTYTFSELLQLLLSPGTYHTSSSNIFCTLIFVSSLIFPGRSFRERIVCSDFFIFSMADPQQKFSNKDTLTDYLNNDTAIRA